MLTAGTKVFVVNKKDGHLSDMTLEGWHRSMIGGSRWEEVEVHTDRALACKASQVYKRLEGLLDAITSLEPDEAAGVLDKIDQTVFKQN